MESPSMHNEDDNSRSSSPSGSHQMLFDAYGSHLFSDDASCIPEFDYQEDVDHVELENSELFANLVGLQTEQQLYQVYMQMEMGHQMAEDFVQQLELEDFFPQAPQCLPSSSSSSLRSLSVSSSEDAPQFLNKASSISIPNTTKEEITEKQATRSAVRCHDQSHGIQFPTPTSEDMAITKAIMAVISSNSSSSSSPSTLNLSETHKGQPKCLSGSFRPYMPALALKFQPKKSSSGQKMIKTSMSMLKRISLKKDGFQEKESRSSNQQLDHILSERKRREKLNGSFDTLRRLLPPGTKKDKASVLCMTKEYLKTLKAEIHELEEKNRILGMHYLPTDETRYDSDDSIERVNVQIAKVSESVTGARRINLKVTVSFGCDVIELVLRILECLKGMGFVTFVSLDANVYQQERNLFAWALLKLDIQSSDWDELSFKEALVQAADCAALSP